MLRELDEAGRKIGLRVNRKKTQFMKDSWCDGGPIELDGSPIAETKSYVYLGRSMNMDNDMKEELIRRRRAAWSAYGLSKRPSTNSMMLTSVLICSTRQFFLLCATRLRRGLIRQPRRNPCKSHTERWKGVF
ncbi:hypothetical protein Q1695_008324 [Nippostrongylus brasiliensis]|nr:hypothetical protein Q1695_008324 [Nippostrongylus brasiliensis]